MANLTSRTQDTTPASEDQLYIAKSPFGPTDDRKVSLSDLGKGLDTGVIPNTPAGNIAATNVQAAINELDTEKVPRDGSQTTSLLTLDTSTPGTVDGQGKIAWNTDDGTVDIGLNADVTLQVGQESVWLARNNTGVQIDNGTVVYANGTIGASGRITVAPFIANGTISGMFTLGVVTHNIANGADGYVTHFGKVRQVDTTGTPVGEVWADGDVLYASPTTAGALTKVKPEDGNIAIPLAFVVYANANGTLAVRVPTPEQRGVDVEMESIPGSTFSTVQQMQDLFHSAGWTSGGVINDAGGANITVDAGTGFIRDVNGETETIFFFDWSALASTAIPAGTTRYVGVEYNAGSPQVVVRTTYNWNFNTDFPLGTVVNEGGTLHISNGKIEVGDHAGKMIRRLLNVNGIQRDNKTGGLIIGETGTRNLTLSAGTLWQGLSEFSISAKNTSVSDTFDYYLGATLDTSSATQWDNLNYNNSGVKTALTVSRWTNNWVYLETDGNLVILYGNAQYTSQSLAEAAPVPSTVPDRITQGGRIIAQLTFQQGSSSIASIRSFFDISAQSTAASTHSNLSNLAWTVSGHTGTSSTVPAFNGSGVAIELTRTGVGTSVVTGAAGTSGNFVSWNADGDAVDSGVSLTSPTFTGNVSIGGNLNVQGSKIAVDTRVSTSDNIIAMNFGETGAGITNQYAALDIDRGSLDPFRFGFDETSDLFRVGTYYVDIVYSALSGGTFTFNNEIRGNTSGASGYIVSDNGSTTARLKIVEGTFTPTETITEYNTSGVATGVTATLTTATVVDNTVALAARQDTPTSTGVAYWDNATSQFKTEAAFTYNDSTDTLSATNIAGTLTTAAQPNVTSVGTLTGLSTSGTVAIGSTGKLTIDGSTNIGNDAFGTLGAAAVGDLGLQIGRSAQTSGSLVLQGLKNGTGANDIAINPSGGSVGIGSTSTPSYQVQVDNSTDSTISLNSSGNRQWWMSAKKQAGADADFKIGTGSSYNSTYLTIDPSGNVGIGVDPSYKLDVADMFAVDSTRGMGLGATVLGGNTIAGAKHFSLENVTTAPTGTVTGGAIMYASGGQMHILEGDGTDFIVGSGGGGLTWGDSITDTSGTGITVSATGSATALNISSLGGAKGVRINDFSSATQATSFNSAVDIGTNYNTNSSNTQTLFNIKNENNAGTGSNAGFRLWNSSTEFITGGGGSTGLAGMVLYQAGTGGTAVHLSTISNVNSSTNGLVNYTLSSTQSGASTIQKIDSGSSAQAHKLYLATGSNASTGARAFTAEMATGYTGDLFYGSVNSVEKFSVDASGETNISKSGTSSIPTNESVGIGSGGVGVWNPDNAGVYSGITLETRTTGASRWLIANEWLNTYIGDLVFRARDGGTTSSEIIRLSTTPTSASTPALTINGDTDTGIYSPSANKFGIAAGGTVSAQFDNAAGAGETRLLIYDVDNATLERVTVGAADSGGAGFKLLRIPN